MAADQSKANVWLELHLIGGGAPVSIVCPGGAYAMVSHSNEGFPFAKKLNERGHNAVVLNYRTGKNALYPNPMEDLAQAIRFLRKNAALLEIDADRISIWGSSAAGHLCAYFAARYDRFERTDADGQKISLAPQSVVLIYPVISMTSDTHGHTRDNLLGENATSEQREDKSVDLIATEKFPATFIFHCEDDASVPVSNTLRLADALKKLGVRHEVRLYPQGGHGCGLAVGTSAEGWIERAIDFIESV